MVQIRHNEGAGTTLDDGLARPTIKRCSILAPWMQLLNKLIVFCVSLLAMASANADMPALCACADFALDDLALNDWLFAEYKYSACRP